MLCTDWILFHDRMSDHFHFQVFMSNLAVADVIDVGTVSFGALFVTLLHTAAAVMIRYTESFQLKFKT